MFLDGCSTVVCLSKQAGDAFSNVHCDDDSNGTLKLTMTVRVEGGAGWLAVSAGVAFNSNRENVNGEV